MSSGETPVHQSQGGARVKVKQVELLEVDPEPLKGQSGFVATRSWTVRPVGHEWKITDIDMLQEERVL